MLVYELRYERKTLTKTIWSSVKRIYNIAVNIYLLALLTGVIYGLAIR